MQKIVENGTISHKYLNEKIKVLHLLKEPTEYNPSIRELINEKKLEILKTPLFKVSAIRSYCIQKNCLDWSNGEDLVDALMKSAVMNISKICRYSNKTTDKELSVFIEENFDNRIDELRKEDYRPDVIICGGINMLPKIAKFLGIKDENISTSKYGRRYFCYKNDNWQTIFLGCWHPSYTMAKSRKGFGIFCQSWKEIYDKYSFLHRI